MPRHLFTLATLLFPTLALAQVPPDKAISTMKVADGLQIELFASEPMFSNPTSIDVDHKGRVWVCESVNYRHKLLHRPPNRPEGDRIVVLEDTDGDGKADKATTFYQAPDFLAPIGIAVAPYPDGKGCKVFVCHSPYIYVFEDKDGDLKADGPPKILLKGFQGIDHDHGVHGINIGPDGKLYFTVGDQGVKDLQSSDGKGRKWTTNHTDCQAGTVWRCNQDGTGLELIAHNFRNNYECCVNSFGEIWLSDNDDDGNQQTRICYVMPGGNYGYWPRGPGQSHWHEEQPGIVHKVLRTGFGSPTGICFYEGTLLPKKYQGQLLHCDAGPREFRCFHIKPKGAGYEVEKELLVTSTDSWFRLSDVCVAPDGSVMLADWYDPGVGGHGMGDTTRGRIYRVTPKGHKGYKVPKVDVSTAKGAAEALASPNLATQNAAWRALHAMRPNESLPALAKLLGSNLASPVGSRIMWFVYGFDRGPAQVSGMFLDNVAPKHMDGGMWMVEMKVKYQELAFASFNARTMESVEWARKTGRPIEKSLPLLRWNSSPAHARDDLIRIRLLPVSPATQEFYTLAKLYDGQDRFYLSALNIACGTDPARRDAILADFDKHFPEWNDKVADLVWELRPKSMLPKMEKLLGDDKLTPKQKARIIDILAGSDDVAAAKTLLAMLRTNPPTEMRDRVLENLRLFLPTKWKALAGGPELKQIIAELLAKDEAQPVALQLIALDGRTEWIGPLAAAAANETAPLTTRAQAIRTLGKLHDMQAVAELDKILRGALIPKSRPPAKMPIAVIDAAIAALGEQAGQGTGSQAIRTAQYILRVIVTAHGDPIEAKRSAIAALAGSQAGSDWLLALKKDGKLSEALVADAGRLLRNSPFQPVRNKAMLLFPPPGKLDPKKLPTIAILAKRSGNAENGRKILAASIKNEAQCLKCHTVRGVGGQVGPDLSMIGKKASRENLIESILSPSKAIADQFLQWRIETKKGVDIQGLIVEETADSILLRDANAKDYRIAKSDIDTRTKSAVSIMPADIVAALTEDELIDLVEYLATLKTASLTPDWWHIIGPFPNDAGDSGLDEVYAPEKKVDLTATYSSPQRKQGELKWTKVLRDGAGYVDLQAHYAPKSEFIMSYLYREIESPADQEAVISLGADDGAKLWLNGNKVYETRAHEAAAPDKARVKVKLKKGTNQLLLKIVNGNNPHGFYLTLLSDQELKAGK